MTDHDGIVLDGAGATGLLAAIECALAGQRVTVLEHGGFPNSFDQHRATRLLVPGDVIATRRMVAAHRRWLALETLLRTRFYRRVGVVTVWPREQLASVVATAIAAGVTVRTVAPEKLPHLGVPAGTTGVLEVDAGVLLAGRVARAAMAWLAGHPLVTLRPAEPAPGEPPRRQTVVYLRPPSTLVPWWARAPAALGLGTDGRGWVVPSGDGTLVKIGSDGATGTGTHRLLCARILADLDHYTVVGTRAGQDPIDTAAPSPA